jgi:hypothetical protein
METGLTTLEHCVVPAHVRSLVRGGLRYLWHPGALLTRAEAEYAIGQLWRLCAGNADWRAEPAVAIAAVDRDAVIAMHELNPGRLPWVALDRLLPCGCQLPLDTARLPALCCLRAVASAVFRGRGEFPLDLVAATFLLLTRWEEVHHPGRPDAHGRARSADSLACRQGFADRPVLDEWAMVLRAWLQAAAPSWRARTQPFRVALTHDVDLPQRYPSGWHVLRACLAELLIYSHRPREAVRVFREGLRAAKETDLDPYVKSTRRQMRFCTRLGIRGTFNLMTALPSRYDRGYDVRESPCPELVEEMRKHGHRIGWHPGYRAARHPSVFAAEKERMDRLMGGSRYGGRHHYLRWSAETSWDRWEDHGLLYDSSVGYADTIGFRCGTASPFSCFSLRRQRPLSLAWIPTGPFRPNKEGD